jgi:hypothetical protein
MIPFELQSKRPPFGGLLLILAEKDYLPFQGE